MTHEMARDASSFLVPHQSSDDLMAQGVPPREARRRSFLRTWVMERLSTLIELTLLWALIIPLLVALLLLLTLFFAKICDALDGQDAAGDIGSFLFDHVEDSCDTPLGFLVALFWVVLFFKMTLIYIWSRIARHIHESSCCTGRCCESLKCFFYYCLVIPTVLFEFTWPTATFVSLVLARDCSGKLQASAWLVLSPYLLKAFAMTMIILWRPCLKPIFYRTGLMTDPANLVNNFTRLTYSAEAFNDDGGYATSCAICLADFEEQDHIVLAPCATAKHVFHRSCLASWFQTAQTCPLCRSHLHSQTATLPSSSQREVPLTA